VLDDRNWFFKAPVRQRVEVPAHFSRGCVIKEIDVRKLGVAIQLLGGGRMKVTDSVNPHVGLTGLRRAGDVLEPGDPLVEIHAHSVSDANSVSVLLAGAFVLGQPDESVNAEDLIWKVMGESDSEKT
jgi:thymidine phosphorylase